ncbi:hypothetical protein CLV63_101373 [Murinocardiopsis flavida]|uniref:Lipoprotein n=1 Tax=Murinocardiopsis flavida TaxID=645275 RepID=A0A2P8DUN0_9ACTN|nr:hypothetical protein [Murinocardiopsis flavida]PSL00894.1 hypothetical protein CLV63_101373 [Murinocardiopsis flavida]
MTHHPTPTAPVRVLLALVTALLLAATAACGGGGAPSTEPGIADESGEPVTDDTDIDRLAGHLADLGRDNIAEIVEDRENTDVTALEAPYLTDWTLYRIAHRGPAQDLEYIVGDGPDEALFLRADPDSFARMLAEDGVEIDSGTTAETIARDYLYATRPTDFHSYVVDGTDDIKLSKSEEEKERPRIEREHGEDVHPPKAAEGSSGEYTVTAYTVYGMSLQRHTIAFGPDGAVDDNVDTLADDLPTPVSL